MPRTVLAKLGFRLEKAIKVDPAEVAGFEHMPRAQEDGLVHGDEFAFEPKEIPGLLRRVGELLSNKKILGKDGTTTPLSAIVNEDITPANLDDAAKAVDAKLK